jgi:hypothetical protein
MTTTTTVDAMVVLYVGDGDLAASICCRLGHVVVVVVVDCRHDCCWQHLYRGRFVFH